MIFNFFKKRKSGISVKTSLGRIDILMVTKRITDKAFAKANIGGDVIKNSVFFEEIEKQIVDFPRRKWDDLTIKDWDEIRKAVRTLLLKEGVLNLNIPEEEHKDPNIFSIEEEQWFAKTNPITRR